jgi:hypothetical protein
MLILSDQREPKDLSSHPTRTLILSEQGEPKDLSSHPTRMLILRAQAPAGSEPRASKDPSSPPESRATDHQSRSSNSFPCHSYGKNRGEGE